MAIAGQSGGIDAIGLGQLADAFGKASGLARVELDGWQAGGIEGSFEGPVIGTCGLEHHPFDNSEAKPGDQGAVALRVIVEALDLTRRVESGIQVSFADIDPEIL